MSKQLTQRIKPRVGNAQWEHVTTDELAVIEKQVGKQTFKSGYLVKPVAAKAEKLATTTPETAAKADESPVTTQPKAKTKE